MAAPVVLQLVPKAEFSISNLKDPKHGPKAAPATLDFTVAGVTQIILDAQLLLNTLDFDFIQTLFIDNSLNAGAITVSPGVTNQNITIPPQCQAYVPVVLPRDAKILFTTTGTVLVQIQLLNVFIPPFVWSAVPPGVNVNATIVTTTTPWVDHSGTIAVGGVAQIAIAANVARKSYVIANPDMATETLYVMIGLGTNGPIPVLPGYVWQEDSFNVSAQNIYVMAATAGHAFTAYEG